MPPIERSVWRERVDELAHSVGIEGGRSSSVRHSVVPLTRHSTTLLEHIREGPSVAMIGAAGLTLIVQVSCMGLSGAALGEEELSTGDGYTWLALVQAWEDTGEWSPFLATHNAPDGLETHLTSPFAAVVRGLACVLRPWRGDADAIRTAGKLSAPVLHAATSVALAWGAWRLVGTAGALMAVALFLAMPVSSLRFEVHSFDHHHLHIFVSALLLALLMHAALARARVGRTALCAGGVAGLGIWSGVEMLIPAGVGGLALGLAWVVWGGRGRALGTCCYALGMAGMLIVALVVERPAAQWTSLHLDRLSGAHALLGALLAAGGAGVAWSHQRWPLASRPARVSVAVASTGGALVTLWLAIPDFFLGPYGDSDPVVDEHRRGLISNRGIASLLVAIRGFEWFHLWVLGVAGSRAAWGLRDPAGRDAWLLVGVGLSLGVAAALHQYRLTNYYELFAAFAFGGAAAGLGRVAWNKRSAWGRAVAVPLALLCLASPYIAWGVGIRLDQEGTPSLLRLGFRDGDCDWAALGRTLASLSRQSEVGAIASYAPPGPELAWFSRPLGALATGCHCNPEGMRDARAILLSVPDSAREVARRRKVEFIVQCPSAGGWQGHDWFVERAGLEGLYARLVRDDPPEWLCRVSPTELGVAGFDVWRTHFRGPPAHRCPGA